MVCLLFMPTMEKVMKKNVTGLSETSSSQKHLGRVPLLQICLLYVGKKSNKLTNHLNAK